MCCGSSTAVHAEGNKAKEVKSPQGVPFLVPRQTIVETQGQSQTRDYFFSPSLVSAGGVLVFFAESHINDTNLHEEHASVAYADVVAGYVDSAKSWSSFVDEVSANKWKVHSVFNRVIQVGHASRAIYPTVIAKGNKVFLLAGGYYLKSDPSSKQRIEVSRGFDLLVGEATQDKVIQWSEPTSLLPKIEPSAKQGGLDQFVSAGGSGVVMEDGTLVFPMVARRERNHFVMIIYSKDDGKNWLLPLGMLPAECTDPLIVEWEKGQLLMIADFMFGRRVYESRDMGATWTEAVGTLTRVQSMFFPRSWRIAERVESITTATIAGKKVMLYTQKGLPPGEKTRATALYLWVADNSRTFH
ncbi:trans-sialidase, partial [Trypanosoma rangeli]